MTGRRGDFLTNDPRSAIWNRLVRAIDTAKGHLNRQAGRSIGAPVSDSETDSRLGSALLVNYPPYFWLFLLVYYGKRHPYARQGEITEAITLLSESLASYVSTAILVDEGSRDFFGRSPGFLQIEASSLAAFYYRKQSLSFVTWTTDE